MKYLNLFFILLVFSCSQEPKEAFLKRVDEFVKVKFLPSLNDPNSFEKMDITLDTLFYKDYFEKIIRMDEELLATYNEKRVIIADILSNSPDDSDYIKEYEENEKNIIKTQALLNSTKSLQSGPNAGKIWSINISYSYRKNNSTGEQDKSVIKISYSPEKNSFEIIDDELD